MDTSTAIDATQIDRKRILLSRGYQYSIRKLANLLGYTQVFTKQSRWEALRDRVRYQFLPHYLATPPMWRLRVRRRHGQRTLPDFGLIGPIKSGTSDLALSILLHPNVLTPLAKEVMWPISIDWWRAYYPTVAERQRHAARFGTALSPYLGPWLHYSQVVHMLSAAQPQMKIVLALREPAQRFYSHWKWEKFAAGRFHAESLPFLKHFDSFVDHCLAQYPDGTMFTACRHHALSTSIYWKAVAMWINAFGRQNVLVVNCDDYFVDRDNTMRRIHEFVGLPPVALPQGRSIVNENPVSLPPPDAASMEKLRAFFRPHNERLWETIGQEFTWPTS